MERIWLSFKLGMISPEERETSLVSALDDLEKNDPVNYIRLTRVNERGTTRLAEIRDKVIPPPKVSVFRHKRK